ncbi:pyridoxamine 5'-phosphate oxidase family protein [Methylobacterium oryzihabitans]|uniref:Pyridoxamine 5'-phosphate oxidase n=1 Tax=Methylobacterium oryzihabitans TaxID=2499852 RepID=A0A3S2YXQ9_9HYPH|nr:pyridoxamine 5'-phosphate oxidase family protein [Methylobacterium oryzihabitans]RVU21856.1 pyridoxamine 5'-phosphate oxidase [Methylobacterium oryzihabitans]
MSDLPPFYDDLDATLAEAWRLLADGAAHRRGAFHTPSLATVGLDGRPRLRTVVLRAVDPAQRRLRFHADRRSDKVGEIARDPRVSLHVYEAGAKIQVRIEGVARLHHDDAVADAAWAGSRPISRACYGIAPGPGTPLDAGGGYAMPEGDPGEAGRAQFTAVAVAVERFDVLYLAHAGHRRSRFALGSEGVRGEWITP